MMQKFPIWSIRTISIWAISLLLFGYAEPRERQHNCTVESNFHSPLVQAYHTRLVAGVGCEASYQLTTKGRAEVHVLRVSRPPVIRDGALTKTRHGPRGRLTVQLSVHSRLDQNFQAPDGVDLKEDNRSVTFVLISDFPARWKVEMAEEIPQTQPRHMFYFAQGSIVKFHRKTKTLARKRMMNLKDGLKELDWVEKELGGMTSYSVIQDFSVQLYIGTDMNAPVHCNVSDLKKSLRAFSFQQEDAPIQGCLRPSQNKHPLKPVYVIELLEPPAPSPGMSGIRLEIQKDQGSSRAGGYRDQDNDWEDENGDGMNEEEEEAERDFYLVIKSPPGLKWNLYSQKMSGDLEIVTDASVAMRHVKMTSVSMRNEEIQNTGSDLMTYSRIFVAPVDMYMYAGVRAANSITLKIPPPPSRNKGRRRQSQWTPRHHKEGRPKKQNRGRDSRYQVSCSREGLEIKVSTKFLETTNYSRVSFNDTSCGPVEKNDEYVILRTTPGKCDTKQRMGDNKSKIIFSNVLVISVPPELLPSILEDELGSGYFDLEAGSGSHNTKTSDNLDGDVIDDEDLALSEDLRYPVSCSLPLEKLMPVSHPSQSEVPFNSEDPDDGASRLCYLSSLRLLTRPGNTVDMNNIETEVVAGLDKKVDVGDKLLFLISRTGQHARDDSVIADTCWFQSVGSENVVKKTIISNGCLVNPLVSWLPREINSKGVKVFNKNILQFSLTVTDSFPAMDRFELHCKVTACDSPVERPEDLCSKYSSYCFSDLNQPDPASHCGHLASDVMELMTESEIDMSNYPDMPPVQGQDKSRGSENQTPAPHQTIIIEGLDSVTVILIAFAAFFIGIILTGSLWCIHTHTAGPVKRGGHRGEDGSGDMTPNSLSPMTA